MYLLPLGENYAQKKTNGEQMVKQQISEVDWNLEKYLLVEGIILCKPYGP